MKLTTDIKRIEEVLQDYPAHKEHIRLGYKRIINCPVCDLYERERTRKRNI